MRNTVILLNLPFMMKFVIVKAVIHHTSFLITLKPCVYSPPSSVLQAACNRTGVVSSSCNVSQSCVCACGCKIMLGQEDASVMSSHGVSSVMLGIRFVITHLRFHASLLFYSCFVFRLGVKVVGCSWNVMAHGNTGEEVKGKLANLRTWCIQHYYLWCAHLSCQ
jgi:hypothetical protein